MDERMVEETAAEALPWDAPGLPFRLAEPETARALQKSLEGFRQRQAEMRELLAPIAREVASAMAALPAEARDVNAHLLPRGWYLSMSAPLPLLRTLANAVRTSRYGDVERLMQDYARTRPAAVEARFERLWPDRLPLVREALRAYDERRFILSIPVLLAQADAISSDLLGASVFARDKGRPKTAAAYRTRFGQEPDPGSIIAAAIFGPLELLSGLAMRSEDHAAEQAADPSFGTLNRHAVQHGISVDYGTEANGLRTVVLLDYLCDLAAHIEEGEERQEPDG